MDRKVKFGTMPCQQSFGFATKKIITSKAIRFPIFLRRTFRRIFILLQFISSPFTTSIYLYRIERVPFFFSFFFLGRKVLSHIFLLLFHIILVESTHYILIWFEYHFKIFEFTHCVRGSQPKKPTGRKIVVDCKSFAEFITSSQTTMQRVLLLSHTKLITFLIEQKFYAIQQQCCQLHR